MAAKWQMQDAKAKFAEVVRRAQSEGPQIITHRGTDTAVVLSTEAFRQLKGSKPDFVEHILNGPKIDDEFVDLINERSRDMGRDIDFDK